MKTDEKTYPGVVKRHSRGCAARDGQPCTCRPTWQGWVYSTRDGRKLRKTFATLAAAKAWRADALVALHRGTLRAPTKTTLRQAAEAMINGMKTGTVKNKKGQPFKPSTIRSYERALELHVLDDYGAARLSVITRFDLQELVDRLDADGLDGSTIRNTLNPLRVLYRRALARGEVAVNPTTGLELPAAAKRPRRIASPETAAALLAALPTDDRPIWATAFYAGLRLGELLALRIEDVDFGASIIRVERSWDSTAKAFTAPKSEAGRRKVPLTPILRDHLDEHVLSSRRSSGLLLGPDGETPAVASTLWRRGQKAAASAGIETFSLHEARHTFASLLIAAGVNAKAISTYMGHSSIQITFDIYGHLMPGNEDEAAALLDSYLSARAVAASA